jgi:hypothetical protein
MILFQHCLEGLSNITRNLSHDSHSTNILRYAYIKPRHTDNQAESVKFGSTDLL